jgi:hypothetical protein
VGRNFFKRNRLALKEGNLELTSISPISASFFFFSEFKPGCDTRTHKTKEVGGRSPRSQSCRCGGDGPTHALPSRRRAVTQPSQLEAPPARGQIAAPSSVATSPSLEANPKSKGGGEDRVFFFLRLLPVPVFGQRAGSHLPPGSQHRGPGPA